MATIFTRIAKGEIPSYKCAESEDFYAFLDISPLAPGHTLVIPKNVEDDYIFHLDEKTYEGLWAFAREVAVAVKAAVPCKRVGVPCWAWKYRTRTSTLCRFRLRETWISASRNPLCRRMR